MKEENCKNSSAVAHSLKNIRPKVSKRSYEPVPNNLTGLMLLKGVGDDN
jgi:hypothetical protein